MKKTKKILLATVLVTGCLQAATASAADLRFSGFLNAIGNAHDADQMRYLEAIDDTWGFTNSSFGLNAFAKVDDKLSVATQIIGGGHAGDGVGFDWGFASYKLNDSSIIKFGKIKYAGNMYSETIDVGYVYPWVHAPESIYSENAELFFEAYKGAAYKFTTGDDTEFSLEAYYGAIDGEEEDGSLMAHNRMVGLVVAATNDTGRVQLSYNDSMLSAIDVSGAAPVAIAGVDGMRYTITALGAEGAFGDLQLFAEVAQSELEKSPGDDGLGWYVTLAYNIGEWKPHFTIQEFAKDDKSVEQSSMGLGINKKLGTNAVLKLEVERIDDIIGNGFFADDLLDVTNLPDGSSVNLFNVALNIVF